jgi:CheY-like chemotaxis protein
MSSPEWNTTRRAGELRSRIRQLRDGLQRLCEGVSGDAAVQADRLRQLAQELLDTLPPGRDRPQALDLAHWITEHAPRLVSPELKLQLQLQDGLPRCELDPRGLSDALEELVQGAQAGGAHTLTLTVRTQPLALAETTPELAGGDYLCIELTDDGLADPSPPVSHRARAGGGSRATVERSIAYDFARSYRGTLREQSDPRGRTKAALYLPLDRVESKAAHGEQAKGDSRSYRILVVDDEPYVLSAAARVLRSLGHEVVLANSADQARTTVEQQGAPDLLLTDLNMPQMNGFELVSELRKTQPSLPALYMCGYPIETIEDVPEGAQFIEKPFTYEDLIERVSQLLEE